MRQVLVWLSAALMACGSTGDHGPPVAVIGLDRTEYESYTLGTASLRNAGDQHLGYNLCPRRLERLVSAGWTDAGQELTVCTAEMLGLAPGEVATTEFLTPRVLERGTYRWVFTNIGPLPGSSGLGVASPPFRIRPSTIVRQALRWRTS